MPCARRAGHDQTHERMKKIMKKFLSSLLALTMILSLVIVPANADTKTENPPPSSDYAVSLSLSYTANDEGSTATSFDKGTKLVFTATPKVQKSGEDTDEEFAFEYTWGRGLTQDSTKKNTATVTPDEKGKLEVTCSVVVKLNNQKVAEGAAPKVTLNIIDPQDALNEAFQKAITGITYNGRNCDINKSKAEVTYYEYKGDKASKWEATAGDAYTVSKAEAKGSTLTVTGTLNDGGKPVTATYTLKQGQIGVTIKSSITGETATNNEKVIKGGTLVLTADVKGVSNPYYEWLVEDVNQNNNDEEFSFSAKDVAGAKPVVCNIYDKSGDDKTLIDTTSCKVEVIADEYELSVSLSTATLTEKGQKQNFEAKLMPKTGRAVDAKITFSASADDLSIITLKDKKDGTAEVSLKSNGEAEVKVTASYLGATYEKTIKITGKMLTGSLGSVKNGGVLEFDYDDLEKLADKAIDDRNVTVSKISITDAPKTDNAGGAVYDSSSSSAKPVTSYRVDKNDELEFRAADGYINDYSMTIKVEDTDGKDYTIVVTISVESAGKIEETVTGSSANSSVSFKVKDVVDYDYLYIYGTKSSSSFKPGKLSSSDNSYNNYWDKYTKSGWGLYDDKDTVTIPASEFSKTTGKVTLYVVGIDNDDVAYTGTIEVSQKSYTIEYNVVAGDSVSFKQADFDDFVKTYAYDNDDRYSSRNDDIEISYVTFSLPSASTEGTLYEGKSKIARNDKIEDVDDVTFESVAKAKGTISIGFTAYGKIYKDGYTSKANTKEFDYSGTVVISVVNEDIVYEVGVNSSVKFDSSHFQSFLNTSSKRATLDYVTFDVGSNKAVTSYFSGTGALYRYYSAYGVNSTVDSKDEFYYNPKSSSKNYDLDDVTYVTSRFAKTGDIVYIPFTAYGTRNEKAEGTVAIKVKQTMNFVDVHTYDYFYDAVQWAVNLDITKGTSTTTFSPKTDCTRAQIVTFLWRAAGSHEPRSNSNKFTDVSATKHADYMKAILWATEQGITTGTGNNKFSPNDTCTRAQIVTFLYRFKNTPPVYGSLNFTDVSKTTHSAYYNAILWASNNKIATGYNNIFDPNGTCNRGDAVTFLYRALA